jgi:hypothetical protein
MTPHYDLELVKSLTSTGNAIPTKKGRQWLENHGYVSGKVEDVILSLVTEEFIKSLAPKEAWQQWADVYKCEYEDDELCETLYVKFVVENLDGETVVVMSCKPWGYIV